MLSGSWRRGTVISGSRLSSTVVLEAQYDYSYRATDGRLVSIHEGERFLLLKKTNADWWQARRIGVGAKFCRSMENLSCSSALMDNHRVSARGRFPTLPLSGSSAAPSGHLSVPGVPIARSQSSSSLPQNPYQDSDPTKSFSQWDMNAATRRHTQGHIQMSSSAYISQSSLSEQGKRWAEPPKPLPGQRPLQTLQLWEQYRDPGTGRFYYVNTVTEERSWKPPRRAREGNANQNKVGAVQRDIRHLSLPLKNSGSSSMHR
ncbi:hypothetical protein cypCar_00047843, partial [Cyprinus carpio]